MGKPEKATRPPKDTATLRAAEMSEQLPLLLVAGNNLRRLPHNFYILHPPAGFLPESQKAREQDSTRMTADMPAKGRNDDDMLQTTETQQPTGRSPSALEEGPRQSPRHGGVWTMGPVIALQSSSNGAHCWCHRGAASAFDSSAVQLVVSGTTALQSQ